MAQEFAQQSLQYRFDILTTSKIVEMSKQSTKLHEDFQIYCEREAAQKLRDKAQSADEIMREVKQMTS